MTSDAKPVEEPSAGAAAFEAARWSLTEQFRTIEVLDAKAERLFAAAVATVALFGAVVTFAADRGRDATVVTALAIGVLVVVSFGLAAFGFLRGYKLSDWFIGPPGTAILDVASEYSDPRTRLWLAEQLVRSYDDNKESLTRKAGWLNWTLVALFVELAAAVTGIGVIAVAEFAF